MLEDTQCSVRLGRPATSGQIFILHQIFEKYWEYVKHVYAHFVDLENAHI